MAETLQQLAERNKSNGVTHEAFTSAFKAKWGDDPNTLPLTTDFDTYRASKQFAGPPPDAAPKPPAVDAGGILNAYRGVTGKPPLDTFGADLAARKMVRQEREHPYQPPMKPIAVEKAPAVQVQPGGWHGTVPGPGADAVGMAAEASGAGRSTLEEPPAGSGIETRGPHHVLSRAVGMAEGAAGTVLGKSRLGLLLSGHGDQVFNDKGKLTEYARGLPSTVDLSGSALEHPSELLKHPEALGGATVLPSRFQPAAHDVEQERKRRRVTGVGDLAANAVVDLGDTVLALAHIGNELVGVTHVPVGQSDREHAQEVGHELGMAPGQIAGLAEGLLKLDGTNAMLTHPISTWLMVAEPALRVADRLGLSAQATKARTAFKDALSPPVHKFVDAIVPESVQEWAGEKAKAWTEAKAWTKRVLVDSVIQADPRATALVEEILHAPERAAQKVKNIVDRAARQVLQGKVKLEHPTLEPTELTVTPKPAANDARQAERAATEARAEADIAGERPAVKVGDVYLPPDRADVPSKLHAVDDRAAPASGEYGQVGVSRIGARPGDLHDLLPEIPAHRRHIIERAIEQTGALKRAALDAGFDPDARLPALPGEAGLYGTETLKRMHLAPDATIYDAARRYAENANIMNVDVPKMTAEWLKQQGVEHGAVQAGKWLDAEVQAYRAARGMIEPEFGAVPRPTPEVVTNELTPEGKILERPKSARIQAKRERNPAADELTTEAEREARLLGERMADRRLEPEPPLPFRTDNPIVNRAATEAAAELKGQEYHDSQERVPTRERAVTPQEAAKSFDLSGPDAFARAPEPQMVKELTPERFAQRLTEGLVEDSAQKMRSRKYQTEALKMFRERAKDAGLKGEALDSAVLAFNKIAADPELLSEHSKNRFRPLKTEDGRVLWDREDYGKVLERMDPKAVRQVQARVMQDVATTHANAGQAYATGRNVNSEINRFRRDAEGKPLDRTMMNVAGYARQLMDRVIGQGELMPQMMPYSGAQVATQLRLLSHDAAVEALARDLEKFKDARSSGVEASMQRQWRQVFHDTEATPDLHNVHIKPSVAESLTSHFNALEQKTGLLHALSQRAKAGVVAENLRALVNNDLSNALAQTVRRGDPMFLHNVVLTPLKFKAFMDGKYSRLTPQEMRMYKAISETTITQQGRAAQEIGESKVWQAFRGQFGEKTAAIENADVLSRSKGGHLAAPVEAITTMQDALRQMYQDLGDVPFRLEEAVSVFRDVDRKVRMLKDGESLDLLADPHNTLRLTAEGDGIRVVNLSKPRAERMLGGSQPGKVFGMDSPELARIYAEAANVAQERVFFDYNRMGRAGKWLRSGEASILSGIFSWFFKAMDIPGVKQGLVHEMLAGQPVFATTSKAIQALQHADRQGLAFRRAMLTSTTQSAFADQRKLRELRRIFGWNPAVEGVMLAMSSHPWYADVSNSEPLLMTQPTATALGGIEAVSRLIEFNLLGNTQNRVHLMQSARLIDAVDTLKPDEWAQWEKDDKQGAAWGREIQAMTPDQRDVIRKKHDNMIRWASGQHFSLTQLFSMIGLGGGPLYGMLKRAETAEQHGRPYGIGDGFLDFSKAMFGATPVALADIGLATAGDALGQRWGSYGKDVQKRAFAAGAGGYNEDSSGLLQWMIKQLLGMGWSTVYYGGGGMEDPSTDKAFYGRAQSFLKDFKGELTSALLKPAQTDVRNLYTDLLKMKPNDPARPAKAAEAEAAKARAGRIKAEIKEEIKKYGNNLDQMFHALGAPESTSGREGAAAEGADVEAQSERNSGTDVMEEAEKVKAKIKREEASKP